VSECVRDATGRFNNEDANYSYVAAASLVYTYAPSSVEVAGLSSESLRKLEDAISESPSP